MYMIDVTMPFWRKVAAVWSARLLGHALPPASPRACTGFAVSGNKGKGEYMAHVPMTRCLIGYVYESIGGVPIVCMNIWARGASI